MALDPSSNHCFELIKHWVRKCDYNHTCRPPGDPLLPKRVVDVGSLDQPSAPTLREAEGLSGQYVALSYCWGKGQKNMTTQETIARFKKGIGISELSQTLQDAIRFTRKLGIQYVWIDALCIIQMEENLKDFKEESVKMADYYGNAYITIAAGSAGSSHDGFLNLRVDKNLPSCEFEYSRPLPISDLSEGRMAPSVVRATLPSSTEIGPLTTRGWTFQEAVLSHRIIIYGVDQLMWKCQRLECFEDGQMTPALGTSYCAPYIWPSSTDSRITKAGTDQSRPLTNEGSSQMKAKLLRAWYILLRQYTSRNIGDPNDRMTALAGIAKKMAASLNSRYIFGIWENDVRRALLWKNGVGLGKALNPVPLRRVSRRAPTWSWACVDGSIHVDHPERVIQKYTDRQHFRSEILEIGSAESDHWDPIRTMDDQAELDRASKLLVRGIFKAVQLSNEDLLQYSIKQRWEATSWLPSRRKCQNVAALLEALPVAEGPNKIVGIAVFDTAADKNSGCRLFYCLRLTARLGLLLDQADLSSIADASSLAVDKTASSRVDNTRGTDMNDQMAHPDNAVKTYLRSGIFLVEDEEWFDSGESELATIT